jgi:nitroreductase
MYEVGAKIGQEALKGFLVGRRSIRKFEGKAVEPEVIQRLIETAAYIPSGGNRHAHEFTVLTQGETRRRLMQELKRVYRGRSRLLNSAFLRLVARPFVDPVSREFLRDGQYGPAICALLAKLEEGEDPIFYDAPAAILIHSRVTIPTPKEDCVIAGLALSLAAESEGLGACFVTLGQNAINASLRCRSTVGLSAEDRVHAVVVIGYPSRDLPERQPRDRAPRPIRYA